MAKTKTIEIEPEDVQPGDRLGQWTVYCCPNDPIGGSQDLIFLDEDSGTRLSTALCDVLGLKFTREVEVEAVKFTGTVIEAHNGASWVLFCVMVAAAIAGVCLSFASLGDSIRSEFAREFARESK